jgi:ABC-2 type transport system permease protein
MIRDILTMLWKEGLEAVTMRGSRRNTLMMFVIPVAVLGIMFPLQFGRSWVSSPLSLVTWIWIPLIFTTTIIADSIAGEKERHTLETLLASRLPDTAILIGKLLAAMLYAFMLSCLILLSGLVTVNIAYRGEGFLMFSPSFLAAGLGIGILATGFVATSGILVSLRAKTVRQAAQTMSFAIVLVVILPGVVINILPPGFRRVLFSAIDSVDGTIFIAGIVCILLLLDAVLLAVAFRKFTRNRLLGE